MPSDPSAEFHFEEKSTPGPGGATLFLRVARFAGPARAEIVFTHGLGEHSARYTHVAEAFAARGLRLWSYDLHAHGLSPGVRGDAPGYETFLDDLAYVLGHVPEEGRPLFLMGHSFGAQITLNYLLERDGACRGAIVASPWLRLGFKPPLWRRALARLALGIWPGFRQRTPADQSRLSRDLEHLMTLPGPELMHHRLSARLYFTLVRQGAAALAGAPRFHLPILLLHGAEDRVTCPDATQEFFNHAGSADKTLSIYPEARHEVHNDLGREKAIAEVSSWIEARLDPEKAFLPTGRHAEAPEEPPDGRPPS